MVPLPRDAGERVPRAPRQLPPDDMFVGAYDLYGLIVPPYSPTQLYSIYESSSILSPHIGAYIQNIDGFDIAFKYIGPLGQKDTEEAKEDSRVILVKCRCSLFWWLGVDDECIYCGYRPREVA